MKLEVAMLVGPESKAFLSTLTKEIDRLERLAATITENVPTTVVKTKKTAAPVVDEDTETIEDEDDDFAPRKAAATKATSFDDEDEDTAEEIEEDETPIARKAAKKVATTSFDDEDEDVEEIEEDEAPVKKSAKAIKTKKITLDDVNDACKARAASVGGKEGRAEVLGILKKKFKTQSVSEIKPERYAEVIAAMEG